MSKAFAGQNFFISGAAKGLGRALALGLAADGATVSIDVVLQEKKDVLTVPIADVKQNGAGQDVVRVIDLAHAGHVTEVPVKTGLSVDSYIEVQSGLHGNEVVIVETSQTKG